MASSTITVCIFLTLLVWSSSATTKDTCDMSQKPISKIILSFCSRLVKEIGGEDNYFFSPLSISAALAMVYIGSEGSTERQISAALEYNLKDKNCLKLKLSDEFRMLIDSWERRKDEDSTLVFLVANGVFLHRDYTVSEDYTSRLLDFFKADVNYLDFSNEEELSKKNINDYISAHTHGMVPKLLNEPLDPMTIMVLLNVIYFKGLWEVPFSENNTFPDTFYKVNGTRKTVSFLHGEGSLNYFYHEDSKNHFLELYYMDSNVSMLLVLPDHIRSFPNFELNSKTLCMLKSELQPQAVTVSLPKFQMEYERELSNDMMNIGLNEMFSERADLSSIRKQKDIHVSLMVHKAVIEVDENGSEAAAVSGVGIDARRKPSDHITLHFDHPFQFYLINRELDLILFAGRLSDP